MKEGRKDIGRQQMRKVSRQKKTMTSERKVRRKRRKRQRRRRVMRERDKNDKREGSYHHPDGQ